MSSQTRENRAATTFWFDKDLKKKTQAWASKMNMTLTELLNGIVEHYLAEGYVDDPKRSQMLFQINIEEEMKRSQETKKFQELAGKLDSMKEEIGDLQTKLLIMETNVDFEVTEQIKQQIKTQLQSNLEPIMELFNSILTQIQNSEKD